MKKKLGHLVMEARRLLALHDRDLAKLLNVSLRTVERYNWQGGIRGRDDAHLLATRVHPRDADLAKELLEAVGSNPVYLGLVPASPEERRAARPPGGVTPTEAVAVVGAAADLLGLGIEETFPAVQAAFRKAQSLGLSVEALLPALTPPRPVK